MDRNLDGVFFRVERRGRFENVCFSDLTDAERDLVMTGKDEAWLRELCRHLGRRLREIGDELDVVTMEEF